MYDRRLPPALAGRARGRLAQRLEHAVHIRGVTGSNPVSPTTHPAIRTDRSGGGLASESMELTERSADSPLIADAPADRVQ